VLTTKLIFVDGCLPGIGKSTTSQLITLQLQEHDLVAQWFYESKFPLLNYVRKAAQEETIVPGGQRQQSQAISRDYFAQKSLQFWQSYVDSSRHSEEIVVLDSALIQSPLVFLLLRCEDMLLGDGNVDEEWLVEYFDNVQDVIKELAPVLVYLCQDNNSTVEFLRKECAERGAEWSQFIMNSLNHSPYGRKRNCQGFEGAVIVVELYRTINTNLFSRLAIPKIAVDVSAHDWTACYEQIMNFVGLPLISKDEASLSQSFEQLVGTYREKDSDLECMVQLEAGQLVVNNLWSNLPALVPLIPKTENSFFVRGMPVELVFERLQVEQAWRMRIAEDDEHRGKVLLKHE
jgi:dephospho-CoA kinase